MMKMKELFSHAANKGGFHGDYLIEQPSDQTQVALSAAPVSAAPVSAEVQAEALRALRAMFPIAE
jgi:hypothetical protein